MHITPAPADTLPPGIDTLFSKTKGRLFFKKGSGFLGSLLGKLKFVWTRDLQTAAIGARTLYWNPDFFMSIDDDTKVTVLAHELWHNAFLHGTRLNQRCPDIWNVAGDHVINLMLQEHGYFMGGFPYLMDPQYKGMSTDEVYDKLIQPGMPRPQEGQEPGSGGEGLSMDIAPIESPEEQAQAVADVVAAATVARMTGKPGDVPGEITLTIDKFLNPKLPWEVILFNFFNALTSEEYSFTRPSRRFEDPIVPGITGRNGLEHLIYYLDISGSITDDYILRFNSEVKFIQEELKPERLTLVTFDTKVRDQYHFERDDPFEKIVVTGRGGTDLEDVFDHATENQPTAMIVFTDMGVSIPEDPGIPIIWVCIENPTMGAPYGQIIHLDG